MITLEPARLEEIGGRLVHLATTKSTNDEAKQLAADGAVHGTLVVTDEQTAGRGRHGAEWVSGPGEGLAFSVVLRPEWDPSRWGWLGLAAGLAVAEMLERLGLEAAIKWPNDVLVDGRKTSGILVEAHSGAAVVGIGINVNEENFPEGLEAVSVGQALGRTVSREEVLVAVWRRLLAVVDREPDVIAEAVWQRLAWRNEVVATAEGVAAKIRGFGVGGELLLESRGKLVRLTHGESLRGPGFRD
ncbi:MAG: biotin--[acetyl-CoA-carboxylase] ligase [Akkermansiaceae bacterium]|nr:biotin--[acetyl-CoA-carboxylase] ligase [Akkermansiaceae bacterium]NNM28415.1 biotin--[acetyl-CoA-carboxylase] ligase [Akkermansiaceae bacterium]